MKCILLLFFVLLSATYLAIAQNRQITGKITDQESKEAIPGATVLVKGTTIGTSTNATGNFRLDVTAGSTELVVSSIGYQTQEVSINNQAEINIALTPDTKQLEEVTVVGYGTQKKSDLTGSISSVKGRELTQLPTQRVDQSLQGRAAGVMVLNTDGAPGGNTTIRIRGMNSIIGGNNALVVIDGQQGGNINTIDPNNIESVEVLKDASATAIYGSKGANGVILITTKTGNTGKPTVSYSYNYGIQKLAKKLNLMNAGEFAKNVNAVRMLDNINGVQEPVFTSEEVDAFVQNGGTDWQDVIYHVAPIQNHSLSISGGTDHIHYFFSGGYLDQQGILKNSSYDRYNIRSNIRADINNWVSAGLNVAITNSMERVPPGIDNQAVDNNITPILQAPLWEPTIPVYDVDGNYAKHPVKYGNPMSWNPLATILETKTENTGMDNILNVYLDFKILEGLSLKIMGAGNISTIDYQMFSNEKTFNGRLNNGSQGEGFLNASKYEHYQNTNILTYTKGFNLHNLNVTVVYEQQFEKNKAHNITARGFTVMETGLDDLGSANTLILSSGADKRTLNSYLGRVNYSFADKYLLTASFRADGSSVFGGNNKWGYFPSLAFAWRLSEENFIKRIDAFSDLKMRASWGIVGNQGISPYQTLAALGSGFNYPYNGGEQTDLGFQITRLANPNLKWESTAQTNIGLDIGLFNGRLVGSVDVYKKLTSDLLMYRDIPLSSGLSSFIDNVGSTENKGLELSISGDPFTGAFNWNTSFNISWNKNKVVDMGDTKKLNFTSSRGGYGVTDLMYLIPGEPFGLMYGYGIEGLWKESERAEAKLYGQLPGMQHYTDVNGDTTIDILDRKVIGNAIPKYIFGWSNRFSYKGFDLTMLFQGVKGNSIFNMQKIRLESQEGTSRRLLDHWTPENQDSDVPAYIDAKTIEEAHLTSKINLTPDIDVNSTRRFIEDGSYLRLKNVTLAYNIPNSISSKIHASKIRTFISANNLITFTNYTGYDPEVSSFNDNDAQIGIDSGNYPSAKTYTLGVELSF